MSVIRRFWSAEQAQDIVEYSLLLMVAVLGSAGLMMSSTTSTSAVWTQANSALLGQLNTASSSTTTLSAACGPQDPAS